MIKVEVNEDTFWAADVKYEDMFKYFEKYVSYDTEEELELVKTIFRAAYRYKVDLYDMIKDGVCLQCGADWNKPEAERKFVEFK